MDHQRRLTLIRWVGITFILAGLGLYAAVSLRSRAKSWTPVDIPISLSRGDTVRAPEFKVDVAGQYFISISAERKLPLEAVSCLMGISLQPKKCTNSSVIDEAWVLRSQGKVVAHGVASGNTGGGGYERDIGWFQGEPGQPYDLELNVRADGQALRAVNPHLIVRIHPEISEKYDLQGLPFFLVGQALMILGTILLAASAIRNYRGIQTD